jgi:myosin heavy subunit
MTYHHLVYTSGTEMPTNLSVVVRNPIMEAFGNAQILRNYGLRRISELMKLLLTSNSEFKPASAFVTPYMLEKERLVNQVGGA